MADKSAKIASSSESRVPDIAHEFSPLTSYDIYLFKEGSHFRLFDKLGAHQVTAGGIEGVHFAVWAPNAVSVSVIGDFNAWNRTTHPLAVRWDGSGIWEGFVPGLGRGQFYKYHIVSNRNDYAVDKGDPFAFSWEVAPGPLHGFAPWIMPGKMRPG